jgi:methylglutaconyl-CoA hydratase
VHRAVAPAGLDAEIDRVIAELLGSGPAAIASAKELIREVAGLTLEDAQPLTARWIARLRATAEARDGIGAFLDKRPPLWIQPGPSPSR